MRKMQERIKGGLGDYWPDHKFSKKQLAQGMDVEMEHTTNRRIAKEISKDHLMEDPRYYDHLESMEKKAERNSKILIRYSDRHKFNPGEFWPGKYQFIAYYGSRKKAKRLGVPLFRLNGKIWQRGR